MKPQIQALLSKAQAYLGVQGGSPAHHALIDAYNAVQPLPVGYAVTYSDDWCILGYARPRYDARAESVANGSEAGGANHPNGCSDTSSNLEDLTLSVIRGDWGNGQERVERLTEAGYDAQVVQELVNEKLAS